MNPSKAFQHFLENGAAEEYANSLLALTQYEHDNRSRLVEDCSQAFLALFRTISEEQSRAGKGTIRYIFCSFLYTLLQAGQGMYRLDAYDQEWFFDPVECTADYNAKWAYDFLHELCDCLNEKRKKYAGRITRYDIDLFKRLEANKFSVYVEAVAREAVKAAVKSPEFAAIAKEDFLEIFFGEYKDQCRPIYCHDTRTKDIENIKKQLAENSTGDAAFSVWEQLDFSGMKFDQTDLRYARLTGSIIDNAAFDQAMLWGVDFTHTRIADSGFIRNEMPGADFSYAKITSSRFSYINGEPCGLEREPYNGNVPPARFYKANLEQVHCYESLLNWVSFLGADLAECVFTNCDMQRVNFQGASLKDCTFRSTDLREADFRGAAIMNCDFSTSALEGAIFSPGTDLGQLGLTVEQRLQVILQ